MLAQNQNDPRNACLGGLADNEIDFTSLWQALQERNPNIRGM
jgi:hypothetical protein